jgi:ribosome-binding factor A
MLRLRVAPHLHFQPDDELERGNRLGDLITKAVRTDRERSPDGGETAEDEEQ